MKLEWCNHSSCWWHI